jgi:hypothetical protein
MILLSHLKTGISASQYAQQFIRTATGEREPLKSWSSTHGPFKAHGHLIRDDSGGSPVIVQNLVIANDRTGTVRLRRSVRSAGGRVGEGVEDRGADSQGVDHSG